VRLELDRYTLRTKIPFSIARGTTSAYERVRVRLRDDDGVEGWGEAAPNAYYRESADTVTAVLPRLANAIEKVPTIDSLDTVDTVERAMLDVTTSDASARSAVSAAAHDLLGKRRGEPLWQLFGLDPMTAPPTSYTIVLPTNGADLMRRVDEAISYPILKVKLGSDRDESIIRAVRRAAPRKVLRADANAAWDVARAEHMAALLADNDFELLEQPLAADDVVGFRALRQKARIPIIADESCRTAKDIAPLEGAVHGINVKLSKCGGLAEARRMVAEARKLEMSVMLGCMIESSLGITAAAHLAPLVNYADLDGAALLENDPYVGATIDDGFIRLPSEPGLGVRMR
jgi:L-alanine-DL-glutamate epimerase-like enolase superfamily enzyme